MRRRLLLGRSGSRRRAVGAAKLPAAWQRATLLTTRVGSRVGPFSPVGGERGARYDALPIERTWRQRWETGGLFEVFDPGEDASRKYLVSRGDLDGTPSEQGKGKVVERLAAAGLGEATMRSIRVCDRPVDACGPVRGPGARVRLAKTADEATAQKAAYAEPAIARPLSGRSPKKVVYAAGRIPNRIG